MAKASAGLFMDEPQDVVHWQRGKQPLETESSAPNRGVMDRQ